MKAYLNALWLFGHDPTNINFSEGVVKSASRLRAEDDASGLSAPRLSALSVVVFAGPISLGGLAKAEQVRPPTISRLVNALEAEGLFEQERKRPLPRFPSTVGVVTSLSMSASTLTERRRSSRSMTE